MEVASTPKSNMFEQKSSRVKWSSLGSSELTGFLIFVVCISYTLVLAVAAVTLEIFFVTLRLLFSGECRLFGQPAYKLPVVYCRNVFF